MTPRLEPIYEWRGVRGASLAELVGDEPLRLEPDGVREAFGETAATGATCIAGARVSPPGYLRGVAPRSSGRPLRSLLERVCERIPSRRVALALGGGVDSAVLAALLRDRAVAYTLAGLPGYGEEREAVAVARRLGIELRSVEAGEAEFVVALPGAIRACERPLYNLHPVGRLLLARAVRTDGFDCLVTGDGADQVFGGTSAGDYLPLVGSLGRAAGVVTVAPFLHPTLARQVALDPDKLALRKLALELGVPEEIALRPKRARFAPPMDLAAHWDGPLAASLGRALGRAPSRATDRERVSWTTLGLFARSFPGLEA